MSNSVPRRRAQNAAAQRAYRAKQKQKMQRLEALTIAALTSSNSSFMADTFNTNRLNEGSMECVQPLIPTEQTFADPSTISSDKGQIYRPYDTSVNFSSFHALINSCPLRERRTFHIVIMREGFTVRDIVKYGLIRLGYAMDPYLFESAKHAPTRAWIGEVRAIIGDIDIKAVVAAGVKLLGGLPLPSTLLGGGDEEVIQRIVFPPQSSIPTSHITFTTMSLLSAFFANATLLGIPLSAMTEDEDIEMQPRALQCTKPDLLPTPAQLTVPHHPSFDVIPWPVFRSNICLALAQHPPLIDDGELCLDLGNDGIRCWGSTAGVSLHGRGRGAPWDNRSWEAAPWFLEKWEMLTGGRDGDMWKNSEWWRAMRD
ncbi:hypothetical protein F5Y19DRAFT_466784 [Xylariaceae sp. FL1651]|nr:hypothetical protein F5Y19DRAFT_466784 [Xylariaceae sp. FL1651]